MCGWVCLRLCLCSNLYETKLQRIDKHIIISRCFISVGLRLSGQKLQISFHKLPLSNLSVIIFLTLNSALYPVLLFRYRIAYYSPERQKATVKREDSDTQVKGMGKHISKRGMRKLRFSVTADMMDTIKRKSCSVFTVSLQEVADSTWHQASIQGICQGHRLNYFPPVIPLLPLDIHPQPGRGCDPFSALHRQKQHPHNQT